MAATPFEPTTEEDALVCAGLFASGSEIEDEELLAKLEELLYKGYLEGRLVA